MSLINKTVPLLKPSVGTNRNKRKWTSNFLGWKLINIRIELILSKLNSACYVSRCLKHYNTLETLKMVYHAYLHSAKMCGIIVRGNSTDSNKVLLQQKRTVRSILRFNPWSTCQPHFKTFRIIAMPSQCILSLIELLVNNLAYFSLSSEIHNKFTRNMKCLHVLQVNLSLYQNGVCYMSIKVFNWLPKYNSWLGTKQEEIQR